MTHQSKRADNPAKDPARSYRTNAGNSTPSRSARLRRCLTCQSLEVLESEPAGGLCRVHLATVGLFDACRAWQPPAPPNWRLFIRQSRQRSRDRVAAQRLAKLSARGAA
ncbi:MAG TPA: hypothetical protein PL143_00860 [Rhodocyclaceae bacterium]|nr:hypothetical protein [Rhodocyclaceae bacterium]